MRRAALAILDQGMVGVLSLLALVAAARLLDVAAYAQFTLGYSVFLLWYAVHSAVLSEPILVLAHGDDEGARTAVIQITMTANRALTLVGLSLLVIAVLQEYSSVLFDTVAGAGAALAGSNAWGYRRKSYAEDRPASAALQSACQLILFALLFVICWKVLPPRSATIFAALGLSAWIVGVVAARIGSTTNSGPAPSAAQLRSARAAVARYSAPALASAAMVWVAANAGYVILNLYELPREVATLRAVMNLILPWQQLTVGLGLVITAGTARRLAHNSKSDAVPTLKLAVALGTLGMSYGLTMAVSSDPLLSQLYGDRYLHAAPLLWASPLLAALWGVQGVLASTLRGMNSVQEILVALTIGNVVGWTSALLMGSELTARRVLILLIVVHLIAVSWMLLRLISSRARATTFGSLGSK